MKRSFFLILVFCMSLNNAHAQLSNFALLDIKEESEAGRIAWNKALEDGIEKKNLSALPALRQANENYIDQQLSRLRRMYAEGDGRQLITAVSNYLQIQKQFVKNVMIPSESLNPGDQEGIEDINKRISDYSQKERSFLIDINNAVANSPEPEIKMDEPEEEEENEAEVIKKQENKPKRKGKLPHEQHNKKSTDEDKIDE